MFLNSLNLGGNPKKEGDNNLVKKINKNLKIYIIRKHIDLDNR
jgi:hypothetical protein